MAAVAADSHHLSEASAVVNMTALEHASYQQTVKGGMVSMQPKRNPIPIYSSSEHSVKVRVLHGTLEYSMSWSGRSYVRLRGSHGFPHRSYGHLPPPRSPSTPVPLSATESVIR